MLELREIWFRYTEDSQWILKGINVKFRKGLNLIIGPNGSGKSTLLKIIVGFLKPKRGEILLNNKRIRNIEDAKNKMIYLPSNHLLYLTGPRVRDEIGDAIPELSEKKILELSEGEGRIVAIISALSKNTDVILLDEPTVGLDKSKREQVMNLLKAHKDKVIIIASNDLRVAEHFDHLFLLYGGKILREGSPYEVLNSKEIEVLGMYPLIEFSRLIGKSFKNMSELIKFLRERIC